MRACVRACVILVTNMRGVIPYTHIPGYCFDKITLCEAAICASTVSDFVCGGLTCDIYIYIYIYIYISYSISSSIYQVSSPFAFWHVIPHCVNAISFSSR